MNIRRKSFVSLVQFLVYCSIVSKIVAEIILNEELLLTSHSFSQ